MSGTKTDPTDKTDHGLDKIDRAKNPRVELRRLWLAVKQAREPDHATGDKSGEGA